MRSTIDGAGRIVIPKALRDRLDLRPGQPLEVVERDGRIEIAPAPTAVSLIERDGLLAAVPDAQLPPLTDEMVRSTLEHTRP